MTAVRAKRNAHQIFKRVHAQMAQDGMEARQFDNHAERLVRGGGHGNQQHNTDQQTRLANGVRNANDTGADNAVDEVAGRAEESRLNQRLIDLTDLARKGAVVVVVAAAADGNFLHSTTVAGAAIIWMIHFLVHVRVGGTVVVAVAVRLVHVMERQTFVGLKNIIVWRVARQVLYYG